MTQLRAVSHEQGLVGQQGKLDATETRQRVALLTREGPHQFLEHESPLHRHDDDKALHEVRIGSETLKPYKKGPRFNRRTRRAEGPNYKLNYRLDITLKLKVLQEVLT